MDATAAVHPPDPILQAYGLGKLDDVSSASVSQHLEGCDSCQRRVAELSSDEFLGRLQQAKVKPDRAASEWSPSASSSTEGNSGPIAPHLPADTLPPELVDHSDWEIVRELGRGGMGVVYLAQNKLMGRPEVLKVVGRHLIERPGVLERFLREIQSAARLQHPNIVTAYSVIRLGHSLVLTMEYVDGLDLAAMVKTKGPLPVAHASYFIHQAALGLQHAHERGMVHRDVKPANLILARDGKKAIVKVLDFGLAKVTSEGQTDSNLTREGQMLGTPDYIAPEQIRDAQSADIRADIYSLGCTFYYLLTGGPPFRGDHLWDVYQAHFSMEAGPLNLVRPEVPVELAAVVAKMMAKERRRRFQTPGEVARALTPFFKPATHTATGSTPEVARVREATPAPVRDQSVVPQPATSLPAAVPGPTTALKAKLEAVAWTSLIDVGETEPLMAPLKTRPVVASVPGRRIPWVWPTLAGGVLLTGFLASVFFRTPTGTLVFDDLHKDAVVAADGNTITAEWPEGKGKGHARVSIPAGKHYVQVAMNGVQVTGQEVTVESGKERWFKVNYLAPSSGTTDQTGKQQVGNPPAPSELPAAGRRTAPPGAKLFSGKYYKVFDESLSWHQARGRCRELGGSLAIVSNESENRFITSLLVEADIESAWLGATDENLEGRWVWVDGSGWSGLRYENWDEGQPTNEGGRGPENYLIVVRSRDGRWNDYYADGKGLSRLGFVCQWNAGTTKTTEVGETGTPAVNGAAPAPLGKSPGSFAADDIPGAITNSLGMALKLIPAGEFMMGSDETDPGADDDEFLSKAGGQKKKHRVRITRAFYLGATEVTRGQFRVFVDDAGYKTEAEKDGIGGLGWNEQKQTLATDPKLTWQNAGFDQTDDHPVVNVSWNDAVAFCEWLSRKEGKTYRLPTEAEWEYACRAGTTTRYFGGDDLEGLAAVGNVADGALKEKHPSWTFPTIAARDGYVYTAPVRRYNPNAWGLYDMHGNVREWCLDGYEADYYKRSPVDDPIGFEGALHRVIHGGGWGGVPRGARSADRSVGGPSFRCNFLGFRLARVQSVR